MCYELKWLWGKRATEAERKREILTERTTVKTPSEPITRAGQADPAPNVQKELEPV